MKIPMIEVTQNQNVAADHMSDPAVFTPSVGSVRWCMIRLSLMRLAETGLRGS